MRLQHFTHLQTIDAQLAALVRERATLHARFDERAALETLRAQRRALSSTLKHERGVSSDLQWELEDVELRLSTLIVQEEGEPSDPLVAREIAMLRERNTQLEERVLLQLERIAELETELVAAVQMVDAAAQAWAEQEPQLTARLEALGHELEALQAQRAAVADQLPAGALELYDDLQRRHRGSAFAPIRNRQCSACRARLPGAVFDLLSGPDPLVRCPRCGRVLYLPDDPATA